LNDLLTGLKNEEIIRDVVHFEGHPNSSRVIPKSPSKSAAQNKNKSIEASGSNGKTKNTARRSFTLGPTSVHAFCLN
jgi:hypothetical protein